MSEKNKIRFDSLKSYQSKDLINAIEIWFETRKELTLQDYEMLIKLLLRD